MRKLIFILIAIISFSQAQTIQYIGAPTTTVISKGNFRTDSIFYLPKRTKTPTDTAAFRYQISDSSLYVWSGYQWLRAGGSGSINGTLTTNYIPKATGTATIGNSLLYTSGNNLMFNSTTPYTTNSGWSTSEVNATSVALNVWKINDTARGYIAHNGTLMEINNLRNGDLTFVTNSSTRGRFTSGGDFRVNTLGGTGSRVVVASSNGTLSAGSSATDLIDTTYISSRAWRQKGVDSVQFNVGLKVNISDTSSMLTPYLRKVDTTAMLLPYIRHADYGLTKSSQALSVDTALMATRLRVGKVVDSLSLVKQNVLTNPVTGTGTNGYVPKWNGTTTQTNSLMYDNGSGIGINTTSPNQKLTIQSGVGDVAGVTFRANGLTSSDEVFVGQGSSGSAFISNRSTNSITFQIGGFTRMNLTNDAELFINTTSDAGDYRLQVNGNIYNTGSAILAATGGSVGIKTTSPTSPLTVFNPTVNGTVLEVRGGGGSSQSRIIMNYGTETAVNGENALIFSNTTEFSLRGRSSRVITFYTDDGSGESEKVRITTSGESLFGTTTDAGNYRVQVSGDILANVIYTRNNTDALILGTNAAVNPYIQGLSSNGVVLGTSNTARLTVTSTGNIGIATISPSNQLDIYTTNRTSLTATGSGVNVNYNGNTTGEFSTIGFSWAQSIDGASRWGMGITGTSFASGTADLFFFTGGVRRMNIISDGRVAVNTTSPEASAQFEVASTARGFLPPRLTTTQRDAISSPAAGLVIYNTTTSKLQVYTTSWTDLH